MFTVCPKCTLTLAVTANDLRTGQGYVRCGRCSNVFNALLTLSEQPPALLAARAPPSTEVVSSAQVEQILVSGNDAAAGIKSDRATDRAAPGGAAAGGRAAGAAANAPAARTPSAPLAPGSVAPPPSRPAGPPARAPTAAPMRAAPKGTASARPAPAAPTRAATSAATTAATTAAMTAAMTAATSAAAGTAAARARLQLEARTAGSSSEARLATSDDVTDQIEPPWRPGKRVPPRPAPRAAAPAAEEVLPRAQVDADEGVASAAETVEPRASEAAANRTVETIVLEGEGFTQTEEYLSEEQAGLEALKREIESLGDESSSSNRNSARRISGAASATASAPSAQSAPSAAPGQAKPRASSRATPRPWRPDIATYAVEELQLDELPLDQDEASAAFQLSPPSRPNPRYLWAWLSGSIALVMLLTLQAFNHWRDALAASPSFGGAVTRAYATLGVALEPHWDLSAYEVRQQGAEADPKDLHVIHVRLSLANRANRAQPVPLLRLTLLDRYGKRLAQRDLQPDEYWPATRPRQAFLSSDQRLDSEIAVRDPHADSASFELDVCLSEHQQIRCAGDLAPTAATPLAP